MAPSLAYVTHSTNKYLFKIVVHLKRIARRIYFTKDGAQSMELHIDSRHSFVSPNANHPARTNSTCELIIHQSDEEC